MGLVTGLLTLPLAPVRGTIWLAERLAEQAERELHDESAIRRQLVQAELDLEAGELTVEEYESIEDALLARLHEVRRVQQTGEVG